MAPCAAVLRACLKVSADTARKGTKYLPYLPEWKFCRPQEWDFVAAKSPRDLPGETRELLHLLLVHVNHSMGVSAVPRHAICKKTRTT